MGPLGDGGSSNGGWGGAGVQIEGGAGYSGGRTKYGPYGPIAHTIPRSTRAPRHPLSPSIAYTLKKEGKPTVTRKSTKKMLLENVFLTNEWKRDLPKTKLSFFGNRQSFLPLNPFRTARVNTDTSRSDARAGGVGLWGLLGICETLLVACVGPRASGLACARREQSRTIIGVGRQKKI